MSYPKQIISVNIDKKLIKQLEKIKKYPRWKGNRSSIIEAALEEFLLTGGSK